MAFAHFPAIALLDRCLQVSERMLTGEKSDFEKGSELARIAEVLRAAAKCQEVEDERAAYTLATLHFVERTLGLNELGSSNGKKRPTTGRINNFCDERRRARECGTYSTPDFIVSSMLRELFAGLEQARLNDTEILDLSMEAGHFALATKKWASRGRSVRFYGVDQDRIAVEVASRLLSFALAGQKAATFSFNSCCRDSLLNPLPRNWPQQYDAVVGNPPWIARKPVVSNLLRKQFWPLLRGHFDVYLAFILRAHALLKPGGFLTYVVPSGFLFNCTAAPVRRLLLEQYEILSLTSYPQRSFIEVPCIIPISFLARKKWYPSLSVGLTRIRNEHTGLGGPNRPRGGVSVRVSDIWKRLPDCGMNPLARAETEFLTFGLRGTPLGNLGRVSFGARLARLGPYATASRFKAIHACDLRPYHACLRRGMVYRPEDTVFDRPPDRQVIEREKVVFQELRYMTHGQRLVAAVADAGTYPVSTAGFFLPADTRYVNFFAGLLNSALANAWYKLHDLNRAIKISYLRKLPVPVNVKKWEQIAKLARQCIRLRMFFHDRVTSCTQREEAKWLAMEFPRRWNQLVRCQRQIDLRIFELYRIPRGKRASVSRLAVARIF
jgi:N-6 DNA Methylase